MSLLSVLNSDWSDYDRKKITIGSMERNFEGTDWEVEFLVNKIRAHHPCKTITQIRQAIKDAHREQVAPMPVIAFLLFVMRRLDLTYGA